MVLILVAVASVSNVDDWLITQLRVPSDPQINQLPIKIIIVSIKQTQPIVDAANDIFGKESVSVEIKEDTTSCNTILRGILESDSIWILGSPFDSCESLPNNVFSESTYHKGLRAVRAMQTILNTRRMHRHVALSFHLDLNSSHSSNFKETLLVPWVAPLLDQFKPFTTFQIDSVSKYHSLNWKEIPGHEISPTVELPHLLRLVASSEHRALPGWGCAATGDAAAVASAWLNFLRNELFSFPPSDVPLSPLERVVLKTWASEPAGVHAKRTKISLEGMVVVFLPLLFPPLIGFVKSR